MTVAEVGRSKYTVGVVRAVNPPPISMPDMPALAVGLKEQEQNAGASLNSFVYVTPSIFTENAKAGDSDVFPGKALA